VTPSSGNVFADLGFAEPEEELTRAELASQIRQVIVVKERSSTADKGRIRVIGEAHA
jgi:hypothetical protein